MQVWIVQHLSSHFSLCRFSRHSLTFQSTLSANSFLYPRPFLPPQRAPQIHHPPPMSPPPPSRSELAVATLPDNA
ncbi:hypothetical protein AAZX31_08G020600 [Glycine max]